MGALDMHPACAPQPWCARECHQLNEKRSRCERDLLSCSLQGPRGPDPGRECSRGAGGCRGGGTRPGSLSADPRSDAVFSVRSSQRC